MTNSSAIAQPRILPLRPENHETKPQNQQPSITIRLTEAHKALIRRFARLRLERHIPQETVLDLFESHAKQQPSSSPVFYLQALMPILEFEDNRLAQVEKYLNSCYTHLIVLDADREILEYRINRTENT